MNDFEKKAKDVTARRDASRDWLANNYYDQWAQVIKAYRCERDPELTPEGQPDLTATSIATPLTTAYVNRTVARLTAQPPNIGFRSKDVTSGELISRSLMYAWDRAQVQRQQKRHTRTSVLTGWSVRAWYWAVEEFTRRKRVDPFHPDPMMRELAIKDIEDSYGVEILNRPPEVQQDLLTQAMQEYGRGGVIPVAYLYKAYEGPKCDSVFIGDCYPEPHFETLQGSNWFIVERRRTRQWIDQTVKAYDQLRDGFDRLLEKHPKGTRPEYNSASSSKSRNFRSYLSDAYAQDQLFSEESYPEESAPMWTITEEHIPGRNPKIRYVGEDNVWIGEIDYPYDLDGWIAFSDLVILDDMLGGIGDSIARFMRGLQELFDRQENVRWELIYNIARPLVGTMNREFYDDPSKLKRYRGMRLIMMRNPQELWVQPEQAAIAAAVAAANDSPSLLRLYQMITGENNLSLQSNVDPQQSRTATGARIMAFIGDILSKDIVDMFTLTGLVPDATIMYRLFRSEMTDSLEFEAARYNRRYGVENDPVRDQWSKVEPALFQEDGEIVVEVGSTLADDDEAKTQKALNIWGVASSRPDQFNQRKAARDYLTAMGKGPELKEWEPEPPPPPPPEPPLKGSVSFSVKPVEMEPFYPGITQAVLAGAGVPPQSMAPPPPPGTLPPDSPAPMPPGAAPPPGGPAAPGVMPPALPPEEPMLATGAYAASRGRNPMQPTQ